VVIDADGRRLTLVAPVVRIEPDRLLAVWLRGTEPLLGYRVILVADGTAAVDDRTHNASCVW